MGQTIVEKLAQQHMAQGPTGRPLRAGDFLSIRPTHVMTHDNTSPVIKKFKAIGAQRVHDPLQPVFALDHDVQNRSADNLKKYASIEAFAREHGIAFYPAGTGIGHQIICEQLYARPGAFVVASDSHANTYGALGAVGTPVVRTDAAAIWATGEFWWQIPPTVQVVLTGELPLGASGKDVIIALCGRYNHEQVLNAAIEFAGSGVATLSIDERLTIANMSTEWGALVGWFPVDEVTCAYVERRLAAGVKRVGSSQLTAWRERPPKPDADAVYTARITLDLGSVTPHVSGPDTVQVMTPLAELEPQKVKVDKAYLLSCVNARQSDLEAAAAVLRGKRVASNVTLYLAPASQTVQADVERSGAWAALIDAGAKVLPPSCGPCIGLGEGLLEKGEVGISATNRNFKGRMGAREAKCYLASPAVVAASAAVGYIAGPAPVATRQLITSHTRLAAPVASGEQVEILPGFPARLCGRLVFVPQDNLNTDGIYGKDYTYRDDMTPAMMAKVVMENYDPGFAAATRAGDLLVGGWNFGTGSSREQAATALVAKGFGLVVAGSFSQTYQRNAFNNGFPVVECPAFVCRLKELFAGELQAGLKTIITDDPVTIDFAIGQLSYRQESFGFAALGKVPQALVVAGGVENQVKQQLGLG